MAKEIELRVPISAIGDAISRLEANGFELVGKTLQHDIMFDRDGGNLFKSGQKVRMRIEGETATVTYKGHFEGSEGVSRRDEIDFQVQFDDRDAVARFLYALGYPVLFQIKKERIKFSNSSVDATIDVWPIIGPILELEGPEVEITSLSRAIFPEYEFGNPRLKDLFQDRCNSEGKTLDQLKREYEEGSGFDMGNLEFLLG